jgi:hypothetical protein
MASKLFEKLAYDIPAYLLTDSPDARIVGETHGARKEAKEYHERSLALQRKAVERLSELHNNQQQVVPADLQRDKVSEVLYGLASEMHDAYRASQAQINQISSLERTTEAGFDTVHNDLKEIKGPQLATFELNYLTNEQFLVVLSAYVKGLLNPQAREEVENYINSQFSWKKHETEIGVYLNAAETRGGQKIDKAGIKALISNPSWFIIPSLREEALQTFREIIKLANDFSIQALKAYANQILKLQRFYTAALNTPVSQEVRVHLANQSALSDKHQHAVMEEYPEARRNASLTSINYGIADIARLSEDAATAQRTQTKIGILQVLQQTEANRLSGQGIDQNQRMIAQGEVTNRYLGSILGEFTGLRGDIADLNDNVGYLNDNVDNLNDNVTDLNENVGLVHDKLIDLGKIIGGFAELVQEGFEEIGETLKDIDINIVMTRVAVTAEIQELAKTNVRTGNMVAAKIDELTQNNIQIGNMIGARIGILITQVDQYGTLIGEAVSRGNTILEAILKLEQGSHQNEASQHFMDGFQCLATAETEGDLIDAYSAFIAGTEKVKSDVRNQFAAAYVAELLGKLKEAKERYGKTARRAKKEDQYLAEQAQLNIAGINFREGNLKDAIESSRKLVESSPSNSEAKYYLAFYLILDGQDEEAIQMATKLMAESQDYFDKILANPAFNQISKKLRNTFISEEAQNSFWLIISHFPDAKITFIENNFDKNANPNNSDVLTLVINIANYYPHKNLIESLPKDFNDLNEEEKIHWLDGLKKTHDYLDNLVTSKDFTSHTKKLRKKFDSDEAQKTFWFIINYFIDIKVALVENSLDTEVIDSDHREILILVTQIANTYSRKKLKEKIPDDFNNLDQEEKIHWLEALTKSSDYLDQIITSPNYHEHAKKIRSNFVSNRAQQTFWIIINNFLDTKLALVENYLDVNVADPIDAEILDLAIKIANTYSIKKLKKRLPKNFNDLNQELKIHWLKNLTQTTEEKQKKLATFTTEIEKEKSELDDLSNLARDVIKDVMCKIIKHYNRPVYLKIPLVKAAIEGLLTQIELFDTLWPPNKENMELIERDASKLPSLKFKLEHIKVILLLIQDYWELFEKSKTDYVQSPEFKSMMQKETLGLSNSESGIVEEYLITKFVISPLKKDFDTKLKIEIEKLTQRSKEYDKSPSEKQKMSISELIKLKLALDQKNDDDDKKPI